MERTIMDLDEVHIAQAARLFRDGNELKRVVFSIDGGSEDILARNIVGLQFAYNPVSRLLTMFIAARGSERDATGSGDPVSWPSWLPPLSAADTRYRTLVKTVSWRIRN